MDLIHIAIVEDELLFVQQLKEYIGRYEKDRWRRIKVTTFADGCSALTGKSQIGILASGVIKWKQRSYRCQ